MKRFYAKVKIDPGTGCWEWAGTRTDKGYGKLKIKGKYVRAHRLSYLLHYGEIASGLYVCHHCDNPGCVNPQHLFLGDAADNAADMVKKGRKPRLPDGVRAERRRQFRREYRRRPEVRAAINAYKRQRRRSGLPC